MKRLTIALVVAVTIVFSSVSAISAQGPTVEERYYISLWMTGIWVVGDGTYSETSGVRQVNGAAILLSGNWRTDPATRSSCVKPSSFRGNAKEYALCWVNTTPAHHTLIQADSRNDLVPWTPSELDNTYSTLTAQEQSGVETAFDRSFLDTQWIQQTSTLREIISYFLHVQFAGQQLGSDYPDRSLTTRWNGLVTAEQDAITAFLAERGRPAVSGNPQLREVVNNMAQVDWGGITFGNQPFPTWTPYQELNGTD